MDALLSGMLAPDFPLPQSPSNSPSQLSSLRGQPVVLAFSPQDWDPSRAESLAHTRRLLAGAGFGGELLGLTRDGLWCQAAFADGPLAFPLVSDTDANSSVAQAYGVAGRQALFLLDGEGVIRWRSVAAPGQPLRAEDLLAGLSALAPQTAKTNTGLSRRDFLAAALGAALVLSLPGSPARAADTTQALPVGTGPLRPPVSTGTMPVTLNVNGTDYALQIEPRVSLLDAVRERVGLTGSKKGCDHGQCGACTMHADGKRINSCLALAVAYQGKKITTVEGLAAPDGTLSPVQAAFIQHDGFQCGFCTSGQIMSASALLTEPVGPEDSDVREAMSGNLCRCGAYNGIVAAVQDARKGTTTASV